MNRIEEGETRLDIAVLVPPGDKSAIRRTTDFDLVLAQVAVDGDEDRIAQRRHVGMLTGAVLVDDQLNRYWPNVEFVYQADVTLPWDCSLLARAIPPLRSGRARFLKTHRARGRFTSVASPVHKS